uniref:Phosphatidylinositol 3,4,5-trisphosphate 3-phosphatase and dual-specificity protein phosphatase PTEN n=1 Tax=Rhizochromulina marina TaxID=1034831 RepID=A0A7S2RP25_9STRA
MSASEGHDSETWGKFRVVSVQNRLRNLVSKEKRRFKDDKYDLDLTYITPKIVAMGFPASDFESAFRNDADDVYSFFESRHKGHYKFYNLCSERGYDPARFHGRVSRYPFDDHNPPPMGMFYYFCKDVEEWLNAHEDNVVAIHCKAGKGRTGVMITAFLLWAREWDTPREAMAFYGFARTNNQKGITIPSQRIFVEHWHQILKDTDHLDPMYQQTSDAGPGLRESERSSIFGDGVEAIAFKAAVSTQLEHLKENGEEDDSESDAEGDATVSSGKLPQLDAAAASSFRAPAAAPPPPPPPTAAAAVEEEEYDDDEEEEDDPAPSSKKSGGGRSSGGGLFGRFRFGGGGSHKLTATAPTATRIRIQPLMDREWNDKSRAEKEIRGQIPPSEIKILHEIIIHTTPKGGLEPMFKISSGAVSYDSKDMIPTETFHNRAVIPIELPDCPVIDEVNIVFYQRGSFGKKKKLFQLWLHTAFITDNVLVYTKNDLDKAVKDKKHKKFDKDFRVEMRFKPAPPGTRDPRDI